MLKSYDINPFLQYFQVDQQFCPMNKIDRIRRKLEVNKKKSIFEHIQVNQSLSYASCRSKDTCERAQPTGTLTVFPIISLCNSHQVSTNHSERSQNMENSNTENNFFTEKRIKQSYFCENAKKRGKNLSLKPTINHLTSKSLNPSMSINWATQKKFSTISDIQEHCLINTQTPKTVIIITEPQSTACSGSFKQTFRRRVLNRPSLIQRNAHTADQQSSPMRKYSISAWETFEE